MNKDEMKMIEEMSNEIDLAKKRLWNAENLKKDDYSWHSKGIATALYNAGYRKVGDDEIVIKTDIECVDNTTPANVIEFFVKHNAEVRQETAREILLQIKHDFVEHPALTIFEIIDRIADKYDVNLEECHE